MTEKTQTPFRVGGVYRDEAGRVQRLNALNAKGVPCTPGVAWAQSYDKVYEEWFGDGFRNLSDGSDDSGFLIDGLPRNLLPGELHQVDGEWVAVEEKREEPPFRYDSNNRFSVRHGFAPADKESPRAPLAYFTESKRFDPFAGFAVSRFDSSEGMDAAPEQAHPLQLCADLEPRGYLR